ncbi:hypothetical protein AVEN_97900-1 [Araneus ventricosus]|uniref:Pre-C2HC domain-containing protein n=1 Tax=Araneus ventricosus TaxID=182803 RepID=A0A4Y2HTK2_ARAVE|nr:hypothetical protein AVEN_97900-1 [Araneus ventricosus]
MNIKCVICDESHDSRTCPKKNLENPIRKCANCGGPHTASYRGCPKHPKINNNAVIKKAIHMRQQLELTTQQRNLQPATQHTTPTDDNQNKKLPNLSLLKEDYTDIFTPL